MYIEQNFKNLEEKAILLLDAISSSGGSPSNQQIQDLEWYAGQLSKLAYGNGRSELIVGEIYNLIPWCDHTHESEIRKQFTAALCQRPLKVPAWSSS